MSLSCAIDSDGGDGCEWYYYAPPKDPAPLATKRSRRCCSCNTRIKVGDAATKFQRYRNPSERCNYIEERIYGDEVPLADWHMCETCSDLYASITELGFCCDIGEDLKQQIADYRAEERRYTERKAE